MADTITFTSIATTSVAVITVTPVPGTVTFGDGSDDRGGGNVPTSRAGLAANGSCQVVIDTTVTMAILAAAVAGCCRDAAGTDCAAVGEGAMQVAGAGLYANISAYGCLIDCNQDGDSAQLATITWKGSAADPLT